MVLLRILNLLLQLQKPKLKEETIGKSLKVN